MGPFYDTAVQQSTIVAGGLGMQPDAMIPTNRRVDAPDISLGKGYGCSAIDAHQGFLSGHGSASKLNQHVLQYGSSALTGRKYGFRLTCVVAASTGEGETTTTYEM